MPGGPGAQRCHRGIPTPVGNKVMTVRYLYRVFFFPVCFLTKGQIPAAQYEGLQATTAEPNASFPEKEGRSQQPGSPAGCGHKRRACLGRWGSVEPRDGLAWTGNGDGNSRP